MPKGVADVARMIRYAQDGLTTRSQNIGVSADGFSTWDMIQRGMGFSPLKETEYYAARNAEASTMNAINDLRSDLLRDWSLAKMNGDRQARADIEEQITEFNKRHRQFRITPRSRIKAWKNRRELARTGETGVARDILQPEKLRDITLFAQ